MRRRTLHGLPAATTPAGISRVTTLPAPMMLSSPTVTPCTIFTSAATHTRLPIRIGRETVRFAVRSSGSKA